MNIFVEENTHGGKQDLKNNSIPLKIWRFYMEGCRSMTLGKTLWAIILIKLFIMFFILRLFFFPKIVQQKYDTDEERANQVIENLITPNNPKNRPIISNHERSFFPLSIGREHNSHSPPFTTGYLFPPLHWDWE